MTPKQKEMQSIILLYEHISQTVYLETKTVTVAARVIHPTEQSVRGMTHQSSQNKTIYSVHKHAEWAFKISDYTCNPHKHLLHQTA